MERIGKRVKTAGWAFAVAWKMDAVMLLGWLAISSCLSVLPAISLKYNERVIEILRQYIDTGEGTYEAVILQVVIFGGILTLIGIASRLNGDFLYIIMYNSYYVGMQELLMASIQEISLKDLMNGSLNDEYHFAVNRAGSLTDFISGACALAGKMVSVVSLLAVAFASSKTVFFISAFYIAFVVASDLFFSDKIRFDSRKIFGDERVAGYFASIPRDISIAKEIRIYGNTEEIVSQWDKANKKVEKNEMERRGAVELHDFVAEFGFYLFIVLLIGYMLWALARGHLGVTQFLVIYTLAFNIQKTVSNLSREIYNCDYGLFALEKQRDFLLRIRHAEVCSGKRGQDGDTVYELCHVNFGYAENNPVLKDISFEIQKGEVVALVGENGSGKSTLANLLLNMYTPDSGTIRLYGRDMREYGREEVGSQIGPFFQDFFIFHESFRDNVAYGDVGRVDDEEKIMEAVRKGGADAVIRKLPYGMDTFLGKAVEERGVQLSGGENQRIAVARAHMSDKDIMIFDEPAAALDPIAEMEQFMNIRNKLENRTAVLISHRVGFARMADKIIMLQDGAVVEMGNHEELMANNGAYAAFFNSQAEWYQ